MPSHDGTVTTGTTWHAEEDHAGFPSAPRVRNTILRESETLELAARLRARCRCARLQFSLAEGVTLFPFNFDRRRHRAHATGRAIQMNGVLPDAPRAPTTMETPSWFFSDSSCNTVESQRAEQRLAEQLRELQLMCAPTLPTLPAPPPPSVLLACTTRLPACPAGSPTCPSGRSARRWATAATSTRWPVGCSPAAPPPRRRPHSP